LTGKSVVEIAKLSDLLEAGTTNQAALESILPLRAANLVPRILLQATEESFVVASQIHDQGRELFAGGALDWLGSLEVSNDVNASRIRFVEETLR
jgi:hypothetical protein